MDSKTYTDLAGATDLLDYQIVRDRLNNELMARLFHYSIGISTESGELQDAIKKTIMYGKELDIVNVKEEISDILWYIAGICRTLDTTFEELMELNINKLKARYGDKFTEHAAKNRDLATERLILESYK